MTTQRDRLAAVLHDGAIGCGYECGPLRVRHKDAADVLLARGVRVVDAETLGSALRFHVCEQEPSDWGAYDKCGIECASAVIHALDDEL